ncbi:MAG TPA: hypothetical protein VGE09_13550, partial [Pseudoxanthomonas sp.]
MPFALLWWIVVTLGFSLHPARASRQDIRDVMTRMAIPRFPFGKGMPTTARERHAGDATLDAAQGGRVYVGATCCGTGS